MRYLDKNVQYLVMCLQYFDMSVRYVVICVQYSDMCVCDIFLFLRGGAEMKYDVLCAINLVMCWDKMI